MAEARQKDNWHHTSSVMALIANVNRDPKKTRPFRPSDFDPFADKTRHGIIIDKDNISVLRNAFSGVKNEQGHLKHNT